MKPPFKFLLPLLLLALVGFVLKSYVFRAEDKALLGYVEGEFTYVASPLGGQLDKLSVSRGQQIKEGEPLFNLERKLEQASVQEAEAHLREAQSSLALAQTNIVRTQMLLSQRTVSPQEYDTAQADARLQRAIVTAREKSLIQARWKVEQKEVKSPVTGIVQDTLFTAGEMVPAAAPVVVLLRPELVKVRFFVPERILSQVKPGTGIFLRVDGRTERIAATVNFVSNKEEYSPPVIYSRERRDKLVFMVEAAFKDATPPLRPGQPVEVSLQ